MRLDDLVFKNLVFVFLTLAIASCSGDDHSIKDGLTIVEHKVGVSGKVKSRVPVKNDSIPHGTAVFYYESGIVKDSIDYYDGMKHGRHVRFREDGTTESRVEFRNNQPDGQNSWFYEDGKTIKTESFWIKGNEYCSSIWYYPSGSLEAYNCTDFFGEVFFVSEWSEDGKLVKEEGLVFSPNLYLEPESELRVNHEIVIKVTIADVPGRNVRLKMAEIGAPLEEVPIQDCTGTYSTRFELAGNKNLVTIGEMLDETGNIVQRDSVTTSFVIAE